MYDANAVVLMLGHCQRRWANNKTALGQRLVLAGSLRRANKTTHISQGRFMYNSENTVHSPDAVSVLGQRRRRWASIETELGEFPVFAGNILKYLFCKPKGSGA